MIERRTRAGFGLRIVAALVLAAAVAGAPAYAEPIRSENSAWAQRASRVTITRDEWGIPHVHGRSDADAVFGLVYAQAEDDFNRIEMNYLTALGRTAEAEGEQQVFADLRMRLIVDEATLRSQYASSPPWLRELMDAWADGLNFYLATHAQVRPRVLTRFEPWMTLAFSEGSIGWDIERVSLDDLAAFYGDGASAKAARAPAVDDGQRGSNGIALAGTLTRSRHALLLINPHTSFFFRAEAQVRSDNGLDAYGAVTWGQFFIYQGFNARLGWMHTSTGADNFDEYAETIRQNAAGQATYLYAGSERPVSSRAVTIRYRTADGWGERKFDVLATHHGPIVRAEQGKWIAVRLMQDPVNALMQSYLRTKTRDLAGFRAVLNLHTNSSNNTVYADADGNVAYFHSNFVPRRDPRFDWTKPVDGSDPATEWQGVHAVDESPNIVNPATGWIQNTNNWPYTVAGDSSPHAADFPAYMDQVGENARGVHAVRMLTGRRDFTLDSLVATAYDSALPAFDLLLPPLFEAYAALPEGEGLRGRLAEPIALLQAWDRRWAANSTATTLAIYWAEELWRAVGADPKGRGWSLFEKVATQSTAAQRLQALGAATDQLQREFGSWRTPWGEVNRFQRRTADIVQRFDDRAASIAVPFTSGRWGSLASFEAKPYPGTVRRYGTSGNSFVAAVEFGPRVQARAIMAGGQSGAVDSPHFFDQAARYAEGALRDVHFYREDVSKHAVATYHPGQLPR
ncbi:MAG TPA: penicillin acylase family protein [Steroidobacteraceae bacterium]